MLMQEIEDNVKRAGLLPPVHRAAYWDYDDAIADLIADGVDPAEEYDTGETALHLAVRLGNEKAVNALLDSGMNVDTPNSQGMTALHWAAINGQTKIAEVLLGHGADIHARAWLSNDGITPLEIAREMGYGDLVLLLDMGVEAWYA
jgi:hypothetical protein